MAEQLERDAEQGFAWEHVLAPNTLDDPYALTQEVLDKCPPVFYSPGTYGTGLWVVTRFEPIREVFQNNEHYSSAGVYPFFRLIGEPLRAIPIQLDPPEHTKYRKFLDPWFSPRAVVEREKQMRSIVNDLIDTLADKGECDAAYDFGRVYPVKVFMDLMGFPDDMFESFLSWSHPMHFEMQNPERGAWGARSAFDYMRDFIAQTRAAPPTDRLASRIIHGEIDGRPWTDDEVLGTIFFLWDGGMDTVAATSSLAFRRMAVDPALQQLVRDNVHRMPVLIEEFARMHPTVNTARGAKVDHELEGQQIKAGDRLLCLVAAGNFDPAKFEDPRRFRIDRAQNPHLTFIAGAHRCLGINLARFEMKIAFTEFLRRIPTFRLKPGAESVAHPGLMGAQNVPIVWSD